MKLKYDTRNDFTDPRRFTEESVAVSMIDTTPAQKSRSHLREDAVEDYTTEPGIKSTFVLVYSYRKCRFLADGWHRVEAAKRSGADRVNAKVCRCQSEEEARERALLYSISGRANRTNGERRTKEDKAAAVRAAWQMYPKSTDREIAILCGVVHTTAGTHREKLIQEGHVIGNDSPVSQGRRKPGRCVRGQGVKAKPEPVAAGSLGELVGTWEGFRVLMGDSPMTGQFVRFVCDREDAEGGYSVTITAKRGVSANLGEVRTEELKSYAKLFGRAEAVAEIVKVPLVSPTILKHILLGDFALVSKEKG
jgi:uncharacterized ParB-like nuclease family protein